MGQPGGHANRVADWPQLTPARACGTAAPAGRERWRPARTRDARNQRSCFAVLFTRWRVGSSRARGSRLPPGPIPRRPAGGLRPRPVGTGRVQRGGARDLRWVAARLGHRRESRRACRGRLPRFSHPLSFSQVEDRLLEHGSAKRSAGAAARGARWGWCTGPIAHPCCGSAKRALRQMEKLFPAGKRGSHRRPPEP